jgi:membrane-associated protease RseP (regulator of RpoE activity)
MGIRNQDILISLGDTNLSTPDDLVGALKQHDDKPLPLVVLREGTKLTIMARPRMQYGLGPLKTKRPSYFIGVETSFVNPLLRSQLKLSEGQGLTVVHVDEKGPAAKAGLAKDDILLKMNGTSFGHERAFFELVQANGDKPATLEVIHNGDRKTVTVTPLQRFNIEFGAEPRRSYTVIKQGDQQFQVQGPSLTLHGNGIYIGTKNGDSTPSHHGDDSMRGRPPQFRVQAIPSPVNLGSGGPLPDSVGKRLDTMSNQIDSLRKSIEELAKAIKDRK